MKIRQIALGAAALMLAVGAAQAATVTFDFQSTGSGALLNFSEPGVDLHVTAGSGTGSYSATNAGLIVNNNIFAGEGVLGVGADGQISGSEVLWLTFNPSITLNSSQFLRVTGTEGALFYTTSGAAITPSFVQPTGSATGLRQYFFDDGVFVGNAFGIAARGSDTIALDTVTVTSSVPLPAAAWGGMSLMGVLGGVQALRRRSMR